MSRKNDKQSVAKSVDDVEVDMKRFFYYDENRVKNNESEIKVLLDAAHLMRLDVKTHKKGQ